MRISDWSSDVCSSDLARANERGCCSRGGSSRHRGRSRSQAHARRVARKDGRQAKDGEGRSCAARPALRGCPRWGTETGATEDSTARKGESRGAHKAPRLRSEVQRSEIQLLMRISYSLFCLKKYIATIN